MAELEARVPETPKQPFRVPDVVRRAALAALGAIAMGFAAVSILRPFVRDMAQDREDRRQPTDELVRDALGCKFGVCPDVARRLAKRPEALRQVIEAYEKVADAPRSDASIRRGKDGLAVFGDDAWNRAGNLLDLLQEVRDWSRLDPAFARSFLDKALPRLERRPHLARQLVPIARRLGREDEALRHLAIGEARKRE